MTRERILRLVEQVNQTTCGQACLAMLLGCSIHDAIEMVGHTGVMPDEQMLRGITSKSMTSWFPEGLSFVEGPPPDYVVAVQKHKEPKAPFREHWTISEYGLTLDPAKISGKLWPAYKHVVLHSLPQPENSADSGDI